MRALKLLLIGVTISSNLFAGTKAVSGPEVFLTLDFQPLTPMKKVSRTYLSQKQIEKLEHIIFKSVLKLNRAKIDKKSRLISYYKKRIIKHIRILQSYEEVIELPQLD